MSTIAENLTALAEDKAAIETAITEKGGTLSQNSGFDTFATDIATIQTGGSGDIDTLIDGSISTINSDVTTARMYAFYRCRSLTTAKLPNLTSLEQAAFTDCNSLTSVSIPKVTRISGQQEFGNCTALTNITLQSCTQLSLYMFNNCAQLRRVVLGSGSVVAIQTNTFNNTPFATNGTGGTAYVPRALISTYQGATNWSALYAAGTCEFKPIDTETLSGDGVTTIFTLTANTDEVFYVKIGNDFPEYTYDSTTGTITFTTAPASATNNIAVYYKGADNV